MRRLLTVAALALALVLTVIGADTLFAYGMRMANMADWLSYQGGAARLLETGSPYVAAQGHPYRLHEMAWGMGFIYPPPAAVIFLVTLVGEWTFTALNFAGIIAFVAVTALIARQAGLTWPWVVLVAAAAVAHPGFRETREGQISPLTAAMVGMMWVAPRVSGWLAVVAGMIKVYPALGLVWGWRAGAPTLRPILLALSLIIGTVWLWPTWLEAMLNARPACPEESLSLGSITCVTGSVWPGWVLCLLLTGAVWRLQDDRHAFLVLTLAMVAPAPDVYLGYLMLPFVGAVPLVTSWLARLQTIRRTSPRSHLLVREARGK